jgi:pyridoxal phosphate enzyme (YggS family)
VNVSQETSKAGISLVELPALALAVNCLPRLKLRGLMTIPAPASDFARQCLPYRQLRAALVELQKQGLELDTLSMGMTDDLEAAIAEGSTIVRIGTAIFGERLFKNT